MVITNFCIELQNNDINSFVKYFNTMNPINPNIKVLFERIYPHFKSYYDHDSQDPRFERPIFDDFGTIYLPPFSEDKNIFGSYIHEFGHMIDYFCYILLCDDSTQLRYYTDVKSVLSNEIAKCISLYRNGLPTDIVTFFHEDKYKNDECEEFTYHGLSDIATIVTSGRYFNNLYIEQKRDPKYWDDDKFLILGHNSSYYKFQENIYTETFANYLEMNYVSPKGVALIEQLGDLKKILDDFISELVSVL